MSKIENKIWLSCYWDKINFIRQDYAKRIYQNDRSSTGVKKKDHKFANKMNNYKIFFGWML